MADSLVTFMCPQSRYSGSLNLLDLSVPAQACIEIVYLIWQGDYEFDILRNSFSNLFRVAFTSVKFKTRKVIILCLIFTDKESS